MKASHRKIVNEMRRGVILWIYSRSATGWLNSYTGRHVRYSTIREMEELGLIEEDIENSFYRADSGSYIHYKVKIEHNELKIS